jgi:glycerol transport system permease protein
LKLKVWAYLLPTFILLSINIFIPFMVSFNYSTHNLIAGMEAKFVGFGMFERALHDSKFTNALGRNILFMFLVLIIEIPLGIAIAKAIPKTGKLGGLCIILISIPLVLPWISIGLSWRLMVKSGNFIDTVLESIGINYSHNNVTQVYLTALLCDVWHWTPLTVLVVSAGYAAMRSEPTEAAMIDRASRWAIFRHVELPALGFPISMAVLLRFMDSLRVFDEPYMMFGDGAYQCVEFISTNINSSLGAMKFSYGAATSLIYAFLAFAFFNVIQLIITRGRGLKAR